MTHRLETTAATAINKRVQNRILPGCECLSGLLCNAAELVCSDGAVMVGRAAVADASAEGECRCQVVGVVVDGCVFGSGI